MSQLTTPPIPTGASTDPPRLGLLVNPYARRLRRRRVRAALLTSAAGCAIRETESVAAVPAALTWLLDEQGVNTLAIAGGDGTLHHVVNALLARRRDVAAMPALVPLCGGTLNIVARTAGSRHAPATTFARLRADLLRRGRLPPVHPVPLLSVELEGSPAVAGFVFGSETLFHAIALYARFGSGYLGLLRFLSELARGATLGSALWQREGWKLGPHGGALQVDGARYQPYTAVVASTVDLSLAVWAIRAIQRAPNAPGCHAKVVLERDPLALVTRLPQLMSARPAHGVRDHAEARSLALDGPFTLDGELFANAGGAEPARPMSADAARSRPRTPLRVGVLPARVRLLGGTFGR